MEASGSVLVTGRNGLRGWIDPSIDVNKTAKVPVQFENGRRVWIPAELLAQQEDGSYSLPLTADQLELVGGGQADETLLVVPVLAEELRVGKREVESGRVRLVKTVSERTEQVDVPLLQETVDVRRVAVGRFVEQAPEPRYEGDTLVIPVLEEVLVVEKRLRVKEEIHITRQRAETVQPQEVTLRSEEVRVDRTNTPGQ